MNWLKKEINRMVSEGGWSIGALVVALVAFAATVLCTSLVAGVQIARAVAYLGGPLLVLAFMAVYVAFRKLPWKKAVLLLVLYIAGPVGTLLVAGAELAEIVSLLTLGTVVVVGIFLMRKQHPVIAKVVLFGTAWAVVMWNVPPEYEGWAWWVTQILLVIVAHGLARAFLLPWLVKWIEMGITWFFGTDKMLKTRPYLRTVLDLILLAIAILFLSWVVGGRFPQVATWIARAALITLAYPIRLAYKWEPAITRLVAGFAAILVATSYLVDDSWATNPVESLVMAFALFLFWLEVVKPRLKVWEYYSRNNWEKPLLVAGIIMVVGCGVNYMVIHLWNNMWFTQENGWRIPELFWKAPEVVEMIGEKKVMIVPMGWLRATRVVPMLILGLAVGLANHGKLPKYKKEERTGLAFFIGLGLGVAFLLLLKTEIQLSVLLGAGLFIGFGLALIVGPWRWLVCVACSWAMTVGMLSSPAYAVRALLWALLTAGMSAWAAAFVRLIWEKSWEMAGKTKAKKKGH
ncbi:MAG TPA: hypothetical protein DEB09_02935 [Candidatus Magasanikbacteria bacterium]|nr:hypothetical protein [Candidatus Magasanikbacteria bacterium]